MRGIIAAVPTPVEWTGVPLRALFVDHCLWALDHGCDGLNVLGSTGEAASFDAATRRDVMGWAAAACPLDRLMVGTGSPSLSETITLTRHADELGYRVALVLPPFYYKPVSDEGLIDWYMALHAALGQHRIRIFFYNYPQMTGLAIPVSVISELARRAPARFAGIKDSSGDLDYARAVVAANPALHVFPSSETVLPRALQDGFAGCISATVNITAPLCARLWAMGDDAPPGLGDEIVRQRTVFAGPTLVPAIKHMLAKRTGDRRWRNTLPPFLPLPDAASCTLETALAGQR